MENAYYKSLEPYWGTWFLKQQLGEGAFGKVFEAERHDLGRTYKSAIKVITIPQTSGEWNSILAEGMDERSVTSFYRSFVDEIINEVELMSRLKGNTNIVSYEDHMVLEHADGRGWDIIIRMELLTPLVKALAKNDHLEREVVLKLGCDLCRALEYCEEEHIVHRDIKPENIFLTQKGDFKLGDFGIARTVEKSMGGLSKKGTYSYMAPEVYKNQPYGLTVDIYSLGLVLYKLLNRNRAPFMPPYPQSIKHSDREQAIAKRIGGEKMSLPVEAQDELGRIVIKACSYLPQDRYQNAAEMRRALEQCQKGEISSAKIAADMKEFVEEDEKTEILFSVRQEEEKKQYVPDNIAESGEKVREEERKEELKEEPKVEPKVEPLRPVGAQKPETTKDVKKYLLYAALVILFMVAGYLLTTLVLKKHNVKDETPIAENPYVKIDGIDSEEINNTDEENKDRIRIGSVKVGDTVSFGVYEQDSNTENGMEPIEWTVLNKSGNELFLISRYILDARSYDNSDKDVIWEKSSLRSWLNDEFYSTAFSLDEQDKIQSVNLSNPDNTFYGTDGGEDTNDKVFCLSVEEVIKYYDFNSWYDEDQYGYCQALIAEATQYAKDNGAYVSTISEDDYDSSLAAEGYDNSCIGQECGWWWLRSPGLDGSSVNDVSVFGSAGWGSRYYEAGEKHGIRPAMYIKIDEEAVSLDEAQVGDTLSFGAYEQDADSKNGKEEIFWTVLDEKDDKLLLISNRILGYNQYNDTEDTVTWEDSSIRKWLNEDFYNDAFNDEEKKKVIETELDNPSSYDFYQTTYMSDRWDWWEDGKQQGSSGGNDTNDRVFCLSYEEALRYFSDDAARMTGVTAATVEQGIYYMRSEDYEEKWADYYGEECIGKAVWWLRSPAWSEDYVMRVDYDGSINGARTTGDWFGIRPAIWISKE